MYIFHFYMYIIYIVHIYFGFLPAVPGFLFFSFSITLFPFDHSLFPWFYLPPQCSLRRVFRLLCLHLPECYFLVVAAVGTYLLLLMLMLFDAYQRTTLHRIASQCMT